MTVSRERTVAAPRDSVWELIAEPRNFSRWWPRAVRAERAAGGRWRAWLAPPRRPQATVAVLYERGQARRPTLLSFRQVVEGTPFARTFRTVSWSFELHEEAPAKTRVRGRADLELRGLARLGGWQVRRAFRRTLDDALGALAQALETGGPGR